MEKRTPLSKRLREKREFLGLSMKEVAGKIGVAESTYREWEYGRSIRGEQYYEKIALVFRITIYELITGKKPEKARLGKAIELIEDGLHTLKNSETSSLD